MILLTFRSTAALAILFGSLVLSLIQVARSESDSDNTGNTKKPDTSTTEQILHKILPSCVFGVDTVSFLVFSREYPDGVSINDNNVTLDFHGRLIVIIPGFIAQANSSEMVGIAQHLLNTGDDPVLSLNWEEESCAASLNILDPLAYPAAAMNTKEVGVKLTDHILNLTKTHDIPMKNVTLIGHSLGAHVAGFAAKEAKRRTGQPYGVIYGLDPAGPSFNLASCESRLCDSDATYVEIYHTSKVFGIQKNIGDVDLWFNGGYAQPGCLLPTCSHSRAEQYFASSLDPGCEFIGVKDTGISMYFIFKRTSVSDCTPETCVVAGLGKPKNNNRGSFYVPVTSSSPYCTCGQETNTKCNAQM